MLIDSHCHLDFDVFDADRDEIIHNCQQLNIQKFIVPGVSLHNWSKVLELSERYSQIIPALGLHPYFIEQHEISHLRSLEVYCGEAKIKLIGEIGLDYYDKQLDKAKQIELFKRQLILAEKYQLPVIIHARKSHHEMVPLLKKYAPGTRGIIHAFNGSLEQAEIYIKQGFKLGFGAIMTYMNAKKIKNVISQLPLQSIVLETDSPDMPLANATEKRNTPEKIAELFNILNDLRSESASILEKQLEENILTLIQTH